MECLDAGGLMSRFATKPGLENRLSNTTDIRTLNISDSSRTVSGIIGPGEAMARRKESHNEHECRESIGNEFAEHHPTLSSDYSLG
jgi:hypothetical protein